MSRATVTYADSHQVSPRVCLGPGDIFRASGGPLWKTSDGKKISLRSKGPYRFVRAATRGSCRWIEAFDKNGHFCVLRISRGRWSKIDESLLPRPYVILGKKRKVK
jgi:hypothetical protein